MFALPDVYKWRSELEVVMTPVDEFTLEILESSQVPVAEASCIWATRIRSPEANEAAEAVLTVMFVVVAERIGA